MYLDMALGEVTCWKSETLSPTGGVIAEMLLLSVRMSRIEFSVQGQVSPISGLVVMFALDFRTWLPFVPSVELHSGLPPPGGDSNLSRLPLKARSLV